ncbi:uncharacterized protein LOC115199850 [Salmo trutta]|uniref:uncharacterized protein LOC115199850 n=1 Tax=Salmo trutta TaxID=8032 RepID=UPI0011305CFA|nr:uncharacterized protein LOC115199850 [Salmo trutta]
MHKHTLISDIMYVSSSGTENVSLSLTFLGKTVGRHCSVAPSSKQRAWETTTRSPYPEVTVRSSRVDNTPLAVSVLEELPGSVPDLREEAKHHQPCPVVHSTHLDQELDTVVVEHKALWLKRWAAFRRWIGADHRKEPGGGSVEQGISESLSSNERGKHQELKVEGAKLYIPYESAELYITQIAEDMQTMKSRHLEMVQELEENFQIASRENQERTIQKIRSHYQNKLNALKRILDLYQDKIEKKNTHWEERITSVSRQNERLQGEQIAERRRSREEALQWQREKV